MQKNRHKELFKITFFLLLFSIASHATEYWSSKIDSALSSRDSYFGILKVNPCKMSVPINEQNGAIARSLNAFPNPDNSWYNLLKGATSGDSSEEVTAYYYNRALSLAENDPGTLWLLFVEFTRSGDHIWAENCLQQLEKRLYAEGASAAPVISQQLLYYAVKEEKAGNRSKAQNYFSWARRFDPNNMWPFLSLFKVSFPMQPTQFVSAISDSWAVFVDSWRAQLSFVSFVYSVFRSILIFFIILVTIIISYKYLAIALHKSADFFPMQLSNQFRTILALCITLSFLSFGFIPFIWLLFFLCWVLLTPKDKYLAYIAIAFLALSPVDATIRSMFIQCQQPTGSIGLLSRSIMEGYSEDSHNQALQKLEVNSKDFYAHMSAALYAFKIGEIDGARIHIQEALALRQSDPVALVTAGNILFAGNDFSSAQSFYSKCTQYHPTFVSAQFNSAQCYLRQSQTLKGTEQIRQAATLDPSFVNTYIERNDSYFSKSWPLARTIMTPDYSPQYFWSTIFTSTMFNWASINLVWGASFFGLPAIYSFSLFLIILICLSIISTLSASNHKPKQFYGCKICGQTICRKCKEGMYCSSCADATRFVKNESTIDKIRNEILISQNTFKIILLQLLGVIIPGSKGFIKQSSSFAGALSFLILTSIIYGSIYTIVTYTWFYPLWVFKDVGSIFVVFLMLYPISFFVNGLLNISKNLKKR